MPQGNCNLGQEQILLLKPNMVVLFWLHIEMIFFMTNTCYSCSSGGFSFSFFKNERHMTEFVFITTGTIFLAGHRHGIVFSLVIIYVFWCMILIFKIVSQKHISFLKHWKLQYSAQDFFLGGERKKGFLQIQFLIDKCSLDHENLTSSFWNKWDTIPKTKNF